MLLRISLAGNALCLVALLVGWQRLSARIDDAEAFTARVDEKAVLAHAKAEGLIGRAGAQGADIIRLSDENKQLITAVWRTSLATDLAIGGPRRTDFIMSGSLWSDFSVFRESFKDPRR